MPLFKVTIVGPLPWGSGGHHKSRNPVNNLSATKLRSIVRQSFAEGLPYFSDCQALWKKSCGGCS